MSKNIEQLIPIKDIHSANGNPFFGRMPNALQLTVDYNYGGRNFFNYKYEPRGYYLSATPIDRSFDRGFVTTGFTAGTGIKSLLLEVTRKSDKQLAIACGIAAQKAPELIAWCVDKYGLELDMPDSFFPDAPKAKAPVKTAKVTEPKENKPAPEVKPIRGMKLLTADIIRRLEKHPFGSQEGKGDDAEVIVKFFGGGAATWLITEGEKQDDGDWMLFGKVTLGYDWEWGYVMLSELESLKFPPFGLGVERDMYIDSHATVGKMSA